MEVKKLKGLGWVDGCMQRVHGVLIGSLEDHTVYLLKYFMPMKLYPSAIKRVTASTDQGMLLRFRMNARNIFCLFVSVNLKHIPFWELIFTNRALQGITNLHLWDLLSIAHERAADSLLTCFLSRPFGQPLHSAWWGTVKLQHFKTSWLQENLPEAWQNESAYG